VTGPFWEERNANITLHGRVLPLIFVRHSDEASCEAEKAEVEQLQVDWASETDGRCDRERLSLNSQA